MCDLFIVNGKLLKTVARATKNSRSGHTNGNDSTYINYNNMRTNKQERKANSIMEARSADTNEDFKLLYNRTRVIFSSLTKEIYLFFFFSISLTQLYFVNRARKWTALISASKSRRIRIDSVCEC